LKLEPYGDGMSYNTPPRGSGKHWRDDTPRQGVRRPYVEPHPSETEMMPPMNHEVRAPVPPRERTYREGSTRYQDLVVPRIYLEPDPDMDDLRRSTYRWVRAASITAVAVGVYLLGSWIVPVVWRLFER